MYVDAWFDRDRDCIEVAERINGKREFINYPARYSFYYPDPKGKFRSIFGDSLSRVTCSNTKQFRKEKAALEHKTLFESDINPVFRCLSENYLDAESPELNLCLFDIEVDFNYDKGYADPSDPFSPITAVTLALTWIDKVVTLCIKPKGLDAEKASNICHKFPNTILCKDEAEMLDHFLQLIYDADVLSGWNSEGYDIPYTVNRIARVLGKERTREFCLWNQYPIEKTFERYGKEQKTFELVGRVHLDYLELYRKNTYHELASYRLDYVGEIEVGENKIPYEGTLDQLYNNDFEKFIAYNRQDVELLVKLDKKLQYLDLHNLLAHSNTVLLKTTLGAVAVGDQAIINEAHSQGLQVPDKKHAEGGTQAAGAYVANPKTGLHDWIGSVDLNSLYPSVIRSLNMSPETIVAHIEPSITKSIIDDRMTDSETGKAQSFADAWADRFDTWEFELVRTRDTATEMTVVFANGERIPMTGAEIYALVFLDGREWNISANGVIFKYDQPGIIPDLLSRWYRERKELQANKKSAENPEQEAFWDKRQLTKKINLNSLYGALLNPGSRFFDMRLGQSTTLTGRSIAKHMNAKMNEMFTGKYDHMGEAIIYGDTDSSYFSAYNTYKDLIDSGELEWNKEKVIELYDAASDSVNDSFPKFMQDTFHTNLEFGKIIAAGREICASKGLFIKKKRYGLLLFDTEGKRHDTEGSTGKLKAMGLDLKRSDTPEFMQRFLEKVLRMVLEGYTESEILEEIKQFRIAFKERPGWEKGTPKRVNNLTKYTSQYEKTGKCGVGHVLAAINWNMLKKLYADAYSQNITDGQKVIVCKLLHNPMNMTSVAYPIDELHLPKWFQELPFDHAEMEKTIINNKIDNLIGILNWDLSETEQNIVLNNLFSFN